MNLQAVRKIYFGIIMCLVSLSSLYAYYYPNGTPGYGHGMPAKYVFYFIGDGMADVQIHATEAYLAQKMADDTMCGSDKTVDLAMSKFPIRGMSTTFANNRFITGSAAAGTALACGKKTNIGVISMDPDGTTPYKTIAEAAKEHGMKVGIVSSVSIDHATPAVFYAHQPSRSKYHEIAMDLANSNFDYFGGGGFKKPIVDEEDAIQTAMNNGFKVVTSREALDDCKYGDRVIAYNHTLDNSNALYYEIDRPEDHISLAEFTRAGIDLMKYNRKGFFMMVEGGKIDWACHANDARAALDDIVAFDNAIKEACKFMKHHPLKTLIIVTGDHECGGMTIGFSGTEYDTHFEVLVKQNMSYLKCDEAIYNFTYSHPDVTDLDAEMMSFIFDNFGLDFSGAHSTDTTDDVTEYEKKLLEDAFDRVMSGTHTSPYCTDPESYMLYGYYNPLSVTLTHILNRRSGIAFTSYTHTGVPVQVLAMGCGSLIFSGSYDNTDIAKRLAKVMGLYLNLN